MSLTRKRTDTRKMRFWGISASAGPLVNCKEDLGQGTSKTRDPSGTSRKLRREPGGIVVDVQPAPRSQLSEMATTVCYLLSARQALVCTSFGLRHIGAGNGRAWGCFAALLDDVDANLNRAPGHQRAQPNWAGSEMKSCFALIRPDIFAVRWTKAPPAPLSWRYVSRLGHTKPPDSGPAEHCWKSTSGPPIAESDGLGPEGHSLRRKAL